MELSFGTSLLPSPWRHTEPASPVARTPLSTPDRFISDRRSQDNAMSHFFLTTNENTFPIQASPDRRGGSVSLMASPSRGTGLGLDAGGGSAGVGGTEGAGSIGKTRNFPLDCGSADTPMLATEPYTNKLARTLFPDTQSTVLGIHSQVLHQLKTPESEQERYRNSLGVIFEENRARNFRSKAFRVVARAPERILDAADMIDDFYLQLIDWSVKDVLAVGLQGAVYLWDAKTYNITRLPCQRPLDGFYCSVSWSGDGKLLGLGTNDGSLEVWDVETQCITRRLQQHTDRVGALSWNGSAIASGSKDATVRVNDLRAPGASWTLRCHQESVCGLRWAPDGVRMASGGNDNQLLLWDSRAFSERPQPVLRLNKHTAAVKAIAWNPVQHNLLLSGGGSEDKMLRFWNTSTGECINCHNAESQVCGVLWNLRGTELVSSHGFSHNRLTIWKYPTMRRVADLTGHTSRVLHLCMSPDGEVVASAAGDETIRFWRCFPPSEESDRRSSRLWGGRDARSRQRSNRNSSSPHVDASLRDELSLR
ncbi:putative cell division cycle protein [Trypanosoma conorhini]|uniref:Putative cell division cycle protein n=1 Tax=Trypanosoma conorhini TaxID=83891 RepID=A0A3R7NT05_9TRYP|nr:putative cell division cycle protein [Trypanosoma conorhini]RNF11153.1 putative cell division cycle protein [Trypanosoma conorhini]